MNEEALASRWATAQQQQQKQQQQQQQKNIA